ncbi:MAG: pilus assembly protein [Novosphingobium sp.]|uniref:TadE/TadG family type IV pilus assembly protein n=1 Tax=Novosphingobium sp. TaxID=1874826 RepID=UPI00260A2B98|nr:TadE/TadG family type IV pilus assembly protein [Novosphingobium sp.]MCP5387970.1 pilus assembly protein [Novosphingobium sp.]
MRGLLTRLARDERGATIVEFALITPALLITLMGLFDLAYNMYTAQQLQGAIQNAARQSTLEGASTNVSNIDAIVTRAVHAVAGNATLTFERKAYASFASVARPEDYTDVNNDGTCNDGEPFEDANDNGVWDADSGSSGFGGARDAVLYTVTVVYPRAFPIAKLIPGQTDNFTLTATTVLRNQPYGLQNTASTATGNCT